MNTQTKIVAGILVVAVLVVGIVFVRQYFQNRTVTTVVNETIERPELSLAFTFPSGEAAYTYIAPPVAENASTTGLKAAYLLIKTDAYTAFQSSPGQETPPSISLFIFAEDESTSTVASGTPDIDRMTKLRNWAGNNNTLTSFNSAKTAPEEVDVDGVKMLRYQTDGLYQQEVYITLYSDNYYLIVGQFDGQDDPERAVFQDLINSIVFL